MMPLLINSGLYLVRWHTGEKWWWWCFNKLGHCCCVHNIFCLMNNFWSWSSFVIFEHNQRRNILSSRFQSWFCFYLFCTHLGFLPHIHPHILHQHQYQDLIWKTCHASLMFWFLWLIIISSKGRLIRCFLHILINLI